MTLCDAGPLIALLDQKQADAHARCKAALASLPAPLITTWPCLVEAMHLLGSRGGWPIQKLLWSMRTAGNLRLYTLTDENTDRMEALMEQYRDAPMDLADASVVVAAERLDLETVFTLDSHFHAYRRNGREPFKVIP